MRYYLLFFYLLVFNCWQWVSAQNKTPAQLTEAFAARYMDSVASRATIFYGKIQEPYWIVVSNHPYFKDPKYTKGQLRYGGTVYADMPLRWDLNRDELTVLSPGNYNVALAPGKTEEAELHGYHILYLHRDSLKNCPPAGYYLLLHAGLCTVLEKPAAVLQQKTYQQRIEHYFGFTAKFYIKKDGAYYQVRNVKTLLNVLGGHHKELNRFIRTGKFRFKRDAEKMVPAVVSEYEKLDGL